MTDDATDDVALPVPPDYDDAERAAYLTGAQAVAQLFGSAAETYIQAARAQRDGDGPGAGDDRDDADVCPECGADLLASMGADETLTPAGTICPACEL